MSPDTLLRIAKSKATANRLAKSLSQAELKRAIKNLQSAAVAIQKSESAKAEKARTANLKKLKAMMDKMGLSAEDMRGLSSKKAPAKRGRPKKTAGKRKANPKKGTKVAPKYQIKVGKKTHKWTGRGRMPLVFKDYVEKGGALEKCLIK
jgi:DNA-binding protein H-NS